MPTNITLERDQATVEKTANQYRFSSSGDFFYMLFGLYQGDEDVKKNEVAIPGTVNIVTHPGMVIQMVISMLGYLPPPALKNIAAKINSMLPPEPEVIPEPTVEAEPIVEPEIITSKLQSKAK